MKLLAVKYDKILTIFTNVLRLNLYRSKFWEGSMTVNQEHAHYRENSFSARRKKYLLAKKKKRAKKQGSFIESPSMRDLVILSSHYQKGHYNIAIKLGALITQNYPDHPFAWNILGTSLLAIGKIKESLRVNRKLVDLSPKDSNAHNNLANSLKEVGKLHEAVSSYKKSILLDPNSVIAHNNLAGTLFKLDKYLEAEVHYKKAISLKHDDFEVHHNFGNMLAHQGRLDEARVCYETAIKINPTYARGHRMFSSMKHFKSKDKQYLAMQKIYSDQQISDDQRYEICFALAKASEDMQDYKQAFKFLSEGNMIRKKVLNYNFEQDFELFREIKSSFSKLVTSKLKIDQTTNSLKPIFIVGMPRSGTTLVEQIIASHSSVTGAGELPFIDKFGKSILKSSDDCVEDGLMSLRQKYLESLEKVSDNKLIVTDKLPQNFRYLGLISTAFPEAKIVHVKRDPAATCWANYKSFFSTSGLGYCYDLDDICSYYSLYEDLMEFWEQAFEKRIYNLDYESLTVNQDIETRLLMNYLDLEWEDRCLKPQDNKQVVRTASAFQVRENVYQGSSQKWKKFKPFLNGKFDHL